jgi:phosphoenolpyruvate carboxykinase (ATP)
VLDPANIWGSKDDYWRRYDALAARYRENFKLFSAGCPPEVVDAGPRRLSAV